MDDLLKDAIADAKAVRETALENAKIALEEAFTPRLQSMLSKKIQSEIEVDEERGDEDDREEEGSMRGEEGEERSKEGDDMEERAHEDEDDMEERAHEDEDDMEERAHEDEDEVEEGIIEIDGVKYAPVVSEEEEDEKDEAMHGDKDEDEDMDEDLDLDEILKELEEEEDNDDDDKVEEAAHEDDEDEKNEDLDENDVSSNIGSGDNKLDKKAGDSTDIGKPGKAKFTEGAHEDDEDKTDESVEEDIDLEEIVKALTEEDDEDEEKNEVSKLQSELDEHRNVVKYLRSKLNEVNLLNAKLLFTNKLFRSYGLNNDQKMKVVETFDRAHNLREVKLVYSTLAESFGSKQTKKTEIKESKGSASKPVASTKSEKQEVISEGHELRDRFKKLAGIL